MTTFISFKGNVWPHKTMFIPVAFDLSAYNKIRSERIMYMCVKSIEFAVCTILLLDFENVPTLSLGRYFCWWTISCRIHHQGCVQHRSCQVELRRKIPLHGKLALPLHSSSQRKKCLLAFESKKAAKTKFNFVR